MENKPKITFEKNIDTYRYSWRDFFKSFLKSWVAKVLIWVVVPFVIINFWFFRYDDFSSSCHIKVSPSITEWNNLKIKKGIKLLKNKLPEDYKKMCSAVKSIRPELACGGMGGGCYNMNNPSQIVVSTIFRSKEYHTEMTAAIIVHEVCHLFQYKEGRQFNEGECYDELCRALDTMEVRDDYYDRCIINK